MKLIKRSIILISALFSLSSAHGNDWHMMDWGYTGNLFGGVIMFLIVLLALIGIAVYFMVNRNKLRQEYKDEDTALEILKQRYARGEITRKQYEEMKKDIA
jgi:putative membrane protein